MPAAQQRLVSMQEIFFLRLLRLTGCQLTGVHRHSRHLILTQLPMRQTLIHWLTEAQQTGWLRQPTHHSR